MTIGSHAFPNSVPTPSSIAKKSHLKRPPCTIFHFFRLPGFLSLASYWPLILLEALKNWQLEISFRPTTTTTTTWQQLTDHCGKWKNKADSVEPSGPYRNAVWPESGRGPQNLRKKQQKKNNSEPQIWISRGEDIFPRTTSKNASQKLREGERERKRSRGKRPRRKTRNLWLPTERNTLREAENGGKLIIK